jgi:exodeoxyribonuclease I
MNTNQTFFFYDLETSGFNPREARIMQFAGQRTDMNLEPVGEPHNYLIRMTEDVLPDPDAILITGITPQKTIAEGISEAEFLKIFYEQIAVPGTIFTGYNTVRFDDEFMRYLHYRNYYDPYEWQWQDDRSRWDLLDAIRMMRALRPEGMKWPVDTKGKPTNRLELLTSINNLAHDNAHDALSDVNASLALARTFRRLQPKLFDFLLQMRGKKAIEKLVKSGAPFVYTSGKYSSKYEKTTVAGVVADNPSRQGVVLVFDLRYDPEKFAGLSPEEMVEAWRWKPAKGQNFDPDEIAAKRLPIKTLQFNRCPAIAPLSVLDTESEKRIRLTSALALENFEKLQKIKNKFADKVLAALEILNKRQQTELLGNESEVDAQLYEGFFDRIDKDKMNVIRTASVCLSWQVLVQNFLISV